MKIRYHISELNDIIKNLGDLLGISILVLDSKAQKLAMYSNPDDYCSTMQHSPEFREKCHACDLEIVKKCMQSAKIEMHYCHAGLCDVAMPVTKNGFVAAYIILGRIRTSESPVKNDTLYSHLTSFTDSQFENLTKLLPYIVFDSAISFENDSPLDEITEYIKTHLKEDLSVSFLCSKFYVSKNFLYKAFADEYSLTVKEYILKARIDLAKQMLNDDCKLTQIAYKVGFGNYALFSKAFKKQVGMLPSEYKRTVKH